MIPAHVDIAIVGGGMVGISLAAMLAKSQPTRRVALIDAQSLMPTSTELYQPSFDARSTALSDGSVTLLRELGLWPALSAHVTPITQVHVSDRGHFLGALIDAQAHQQDAVGCVVENAWLGRVLLQHVCTLANLICIAPADVTRLVPGETGYSLLVGGETLTADLVVVADGVDSHLRKQLGIDVTQRDYHQTAIVTNVEFSESHNGVAFERFTDEGPLALLPLGESANARRSALIWTLPTARADALLSASDADFLAELQRRFGFRVGRFTRVGKRVNYPLSLIVANEQVRSSLVLLGNAAHFLHPVAGQGFNLALRDCAALVETLNESSSAHQRLGQITELQRYIHKQALDQQLTIGFSDQLVRLFSNSSLPLIALRHLGLLSLELMPVVKAQFAAQTMGKAHRRYRWVDAPALPAACVDDAPVSVEKKPDVSAASTFDIVIVGAGLVGAALACALAQSPQGKRLSIALIESGSVDTHYDASTFDPRVVALTHASQTLLSDIGVWDSVAAERVCAYQQMHVWDGEGTAEIHFDAADVQQTALGHIVENRVLVAHLRKRLLTLSNVILLAGVDVSALENEHEQSAKITLSDGREIHADLIVAADGARSTLRDLASINTREWDYDQHAIVTTVKVEDSHQFTAWQRFMRTGPLAFLPLTKQGDSQHCSIVWSLDNDKAPEMMALDDERFCRELSAAFEEKLGRVVETDARYMIPLRQRHATHYFSHRVVLVGDAAHSIHPLAGQGVNLGLLDVVALTSEINRALTRGLPVYDTMTLRRYQRARMGSNLTMMAAMETFKRLFGSSNSSLTLMRNIGLQRVGESSLLKKIIINQALGVG